MDELDLLKKDWNKDDNNYPKLTYNEIYKMILKKSSSIVKWIFIISLLEFAFWILVSFFLKDIKIDKDFNVINIDHILIPLSIISYGVLIYFFYLFYKNYRNITSTASIKSLMESILKTRKTVKYYVIFNLVFAVFTTFFGFIYILIHDEYRIEQIREITENGEIIKFYLLTILIAIIIVAFFIGLLLIFYWLIYGLLLNRLNRNYKELKKLK